MDDIEKEKYIATSPCPVSMEGLDKILFQMKSCVCKIYNNLTGTGFFCKIPFKSKNKLMPVLITNNHVLNKNDIEINRIIKITINNNEEIKEIIIDENRKKFTDESYDITIIEIKPDKDNISNFLEIDINVFDSPNKLELTYENKSSYLLHYPGKENIQVSFGLIQSLSNNIISHCCSSDRGSSGSPLLSLDSFKVIGIHFGGAKFQENNKATFISKAIYLFNKKYTNKNEEMDDIFIHFKNQINKSNIKNENSNNDKNNIIPEVKKENKIKLCDDISDLNAEKFLILNGKKCPFSNYIDIKEIKEYKFDKSNLGKSLRRKDYIIYNFLSLVIFNQNSIGSPIELEFNNQNKIVKMKDIQLQEIAYSLCYLKSHKLYALGLNSKIIFYDINFTPKMTSNFLKNEVSYIYELKNGKILVTDYSNTIKILSIKDNNVSLHQKFETKNITNFVGIELNDNKIVCGGKQYLSIMNHNLLGYSLTKTIDLHGFISNLVELNSNLFLIGQSHFHKIIIYSNSMKEVGQIYNIYLTSNNYSISKISDEYVAIAGEEININSACVYIFSIKNLIICDKLFINSLNYYDVILALNNNEFTICGSNFNDKKNVLMMIKYDDKNGKILIKNSYKDISYGRIESIILNDSYIIITDVLENLCIWNLNKFIKDN